MKMVKLTAAEYQSQLGRKGGSVRSEAKRAAQKRNKAGVVGDPTYGGGGRRKIAGVPDHIVAEIRRRLPGRANAYERQRVFKQFRNGAVVSILDWLLRDCP